MSHRHISEAPVYRRRGDSTPTYEPHGLCRCPGPTQVTPIGECQRCFRLRKETL